MAVAQGAATYADVRIGRGSSLAMYGSSVPCGMVGDSA
jgi:hypothetical protein